MTASSTVGDPLRLLKVALCLLAVNCSNCRGELRAFCKAPCMKLRELL